jgi:hypothetical protein
MRSYCRRYLTFQQVQLQERYLLDRDLPWGWNQAAGGIKAIVLQLWE